MQIHEGFLEKEWCEELIYTFQQHFYHDPRGDWNAYTLSKEKPLYEQILQKFSPLVGYEFSVNWINITVYPEGKGLRHHKDESSTLTLVSNLNENYTGGAFVLNKTARHELKQGDVLVFNGGKLYHGVEPVISGTRYSLNLWTVPNSPSIL